MTGRVHPTRREMLLLGLTVGAASTDAVSYLGLGHVFPANMTGNTVLLAVGVTTADYAAALRSLIALTGFLLGATAAAYVTATDSEDSAARTIYALFAELVMLIGGAVWWLVTGIHKSGSTIQLGVIALFGMAMGAQSAAIARIGAPVTTTFITGTWTQVSTWVAGLLHGGARRRPAQRSDRADHVLQAAVVVCYLAAALSTGYLFRVAGRATAFLPCTTTAIVCAAGLRRSVRAPALERKD